jgi:phosphatidylglycerophosphate synthase
MSDMKFKASRRVQESVLAPAEGKVLRWLASRLPGRVHPDHLTILGFGSMILAGIFYGLSGAAPALLHIVNLLIFANWFGDSLDGTLARYRNQQRPRYGYYVDHVADSIGTLVLVSGMAFSGYMSERVAFALLAVYLVLSIESYLVAHTLGEFRISFWKFSPTELRILLVVGNLVLLYKPQVVILGRPFLLFDAGGAIGAGLMAIVVTVSAIRHTRQLYVLERI